MDMDYKRKYLDYVNRHNYFMIHNHIRLTDMDSDWAAGELAMCQDTLNPIGTMHGGAYYTLADCVASAAARSNRMNYVTLNSSFEYIRSAREGTVQAAAKVRHRGQTTCLLAVEVTDGEGRLLAEGRFTMFCTGKPMILD